MQINRFLFPIAVAVALAFPSAASATFWTGPFVPQVNNDGVELAVQLHKGQPQKVTQFEFHNVPTGTPCNGSNIFFHHMELNDNNRFNGSGHPGQVGNHDWPKVPNLTVTIHGHYTPRNDRIVGTFRLQGTGGCKGDTGPLDYRTKRKLAVHG
jgi:hypothetical protein